MAHKTSIERLADRLMTNESKALVDRAARIHIEHLQAENERLRMQVVTLQALLCEVRHEDRR